MPVLALEGATETLPGASVEPLVVIRGVERFKHVGGNGGIVDVGCGGHGGEKELAKIESEGVAHCIHKNVGNEKEERVDGEEKRAQGLAQKGKMWPC